MNNYQTPPNDQENRHPTEEKPVEGHKEGVRPFAFPDEREVRPIPSPLASPVPLVHPSPWSSSAPGTRPARVEQFGSIAPQRRSGWPWIIGTLVLVVFLLASGMFFLMGILGYGLAGDTHNTTGTRPFAASAHPTLTLRNDIGAIHVRAASSGNEVVIQEARRTNLWGNLNDVHVSYTQDRVANTITVNVDRQVQTTFFTSVRVDFDITVPSVADLHLKTNTGAIDVSGVSGQLVLSSNTGTVTAHDGTVSGQSALTTNTGSITFNGALASTGTYQFETNTGSVQVTLPRESSFHVDASTDAGSISTTFPGVIVQHTQVVGASIHSDVGSAPQATVTLRTNTGSISLNQHER